MLVLLLLTSVPNVIICYIVTLVFSTRLKVIFLIFTSSEFVEHRSTIKFCLRNEISVAETFRMLQKAFGDLTMSQKNVYKWHKDFKEGRERVDDLKCPGGPSTSTNEQRVNQIKKLVHKNIFTRSSHIIPVHGITSFSAISFSYSFTVSAFPSLPLSFN